MASATHQGRVAVVATLRDISERLEAREALHRSEERYRSFVEMSEDLIWRCDAEGRFIYLNPAWQTVLGYPTEEMLGRPFSDFKMSDRRGQDTTRFAAVLDGERATAYETVYVHRSGRHVFLRFNSIRIVESGTVVGTQGTAFDVTESRRAEELLRSSLAEKEEALRKQREAESKRQESEGRFQSIVESVADGIVMVDGDGDIRLVNQGTVVQFGYSRDELIGQSIQTLIPRRYRERHPDLSKQYMAEPSHRMMGDSSDLLWVPKGRY